MKLSIAVTAAAAVIAPGRPALAAYSGSPASLDLSKDLEDAPSLNKSPGALAVIDAAESDSFIRTAMVLEDGKVVASYVRDGVDPEDPQQTHSVTKSVASLLMGVLLHEGALSSLDETLGDIFTDESIWEDVPDVEFRKAITIKEMLTMTSGLLFGGWNAELIIGSCENGLKAWLSTPFIGTKGKFDYLIVSDILSYVIVERAGMTPRQFLVDRVLSPLGFQDSEIEWPHLWECHNRIPDDRPEMAFNQLHLTPKQMAKIGLLYLAQGAAGPDERIVSREFIEDSLTEHVIVETFMWSNPDSDINKGASHGYLWYKDAVSFENWCAMGAEGQVICIDSVQGRVSVQQRDPSGEVFMSAGSDYPAFVALDPSLSFDSAESEMSAGSDADVKVW